ncbi:hypothetical protein OAN24_06435 [Pseudodesulfovibrio sp.]|nr:hypothetical protein [Pseudodesulfovibrio sp.]
MYLEIMNVVPNEKAGQALEYSQGVVRWTIDGTIADVANSVRQRNIQAITFVDNEFFADHPMAIAMCREMRVLDMNVLWTAYVGDMPSSELLMEMRLAGCQRLEMTLHPAAAAQALAAAREFGFEVRICDTDGTPCVSDPTQYTIAERQSIAERLPGLHSVQYDLAVAYYKARRFQEVMQPLGKAMTLRFPMNELCLNLLACLGAAKHYPEMAAGLLDQAQHGCPHPVVFRNRRLLKMWLESGGDVKGVRLMLEPEPVSMVTA